MVQAPNILWIVTTQWRAQACAYAGDPNARTPCLDALARESVNYVQAVTPHPFGPFARAALLTGVPSPANGVHDYFDPLPAHGRTIAHELGARGYATAYFGKWHLGNRDPHAPLVGEASAKAVVPAEARGGFAFWEGFEGGFLANDPWLHGTRLPHPVRFEGYQSDVVCARAAEFLRGSSGPWFCCVSLEAPHPPYDAPASGVRPSAASGLSLPPNVPKGNLSEERARRELAGYYAHIEATDRAVGRLVEAAPCRGAIVVFTSVHGDMHGAHGLFRKGWPYEESVRVPLLVRRPGVPAAADSSSISLLDLPAQTLAWAQRTPPPPLPVQASLSMPSVVRLPDQCDRIWRGVRTPARKLILSEDGSPWLFFDLKNDPYELQNLASAPSSAPEIEELRRSEAFQPNFKTEKSKNQ